MKRRLLSAVLLLLVAAACDRDPSGAGGPVALVVLSPDGRVLARGETLELAATVRDRGGEQPSEARLEKLAWSSSVPSVATVAGGTVTAVAPGTTTIRAELDGIAATVEVRVADPAADCSGPGALVSVPVGGSVTVGGVEASLLCLEGGTAGRDYVVVPFNASAPGGGFANVHLTAQGVVPPAPLAAAAAPALLLSAGAGPRPDHGFHQRLRARAERELAPLVAAAQRAGAEAMAPSFALDLRNPSVGQQVQVNSSLASCSKDSAVMRTGRVVAVGSRSVVVADVANPAGGLTDAEYASFAAGFDTLVWPVVTGAFGEPRDVDSNGRVVIFYTRAVNELTQIGSGSYVGGYFHPRDLFPTRARDGVAACAASNVAEVVYMLVPDPTGSINNNVFSRDLVLRKSLGTIGHELQHLINASRRLYVVGTTHWNEETWLNEALSHVAEEILFHRVSGLGPGQNLRAADFSAAGRAREAFLAYQEENIRRLDRYLSDVESEAAYDAAVNDNNDLATRGAGWAFLRYVADRRGGSETALWKAMVDGSTTGLANLQQALGSDPRPWVRDWTVSLYADDLVSGLAPRHTQPSWHLRSFWTQYPLRVRSFGVSPLTLNVKAGTSAFVRLGVPAGTTAPIQARSTATAPLPSSVMVTVVRTR